MKIVLYVLVGLTIGVISGTLGIGGGVLLVPALIWIFGFDQPRAIGTTLAILVPPVGLLAAREFYSKGLMDLEAAAWIAGSFALGAYGGALLMPSIPIGTLRLAFGLMLIYIGVRFLLSAESEVANAVVGLVGVGLAWMTYLYLRLLGRRHFPAPTLSDQARRLQEQGRGETDYHI